MKYLLLLMLLAGCAETPVLQPGPETDIPIAVHCRHAPLEKPAMPLEALTDNASAADLFRACLESDKLRQAYEMQCEADVRACE